MKIIHHTILTATAALSLLLALSASGPAQAQAPKPPTDAKRVVHSVKAGEIKFEAGKSGRFVIPKKVRDFDLTVALTNPSVSEWASGVVFRAGNGSAKMILFGGDGQIGMGTVNDGQEQPDFKASFAASVKKDSGAVNNLALYVRGASALVFVNKTYIDTYQLGDAGDFGELWLFASGKEAGSLKFKTLSVRAPNNALPPADVVTEKPAATTMLIKLYSSGYERHGRPAGMDNRVAGCNSFDDSRPVTSFQARLNVRNNSDKPIKRYVGAGIKPDGKVAYTCYYITGQDGVAEIPPGDSRDITIQAFVEQGEKIAYVVVYDIDAKQESNRVTIP
jgi:hypothetical protein